MLHIVWFKRDLRVHDHQPLVEAQRRGTVLPLYVAEPSVLASSDFSVRHWRFIRSCLLELRERLAALGQPLVVRVGEVVDVLADLHEQLGPFTIWAHQETGNDITYRRDLMVQAWCREHGIAFHELPHRGIQRGLKNRRDWSDRYTTYMEAPEAPTPTALRPIANVDPGPIPSAADLTLSDNLPSELEQKGGEASALRLLDSFLSERAAAYRYQMSHPLLSRKSCSRLSPHLAWGSLSLRHVFHAAHQRLATIRATPHAPGPRPQAIQAFVSRLYWNGHFVQKLESEPRMEFESLVPLYDSLRTDFDASHYEAFVNGQTGYPLVDACLRCVRSTGYLNFRMRALLVSFAAHDLWLDWRRIHPVLAQWWIDYEPGIHLSQLQMQAGTSGNRTLRLYNPTKQGLEHDADGAFTRLWVPELKRVPDAFLHTPWLMPPAAQEASNCRIGTDYPAPIVDHDTAARKARAAIAQLRRDPELERQRQAALAIHGDPKRSGNASRKTGVKPNVDQPTATQLGLGLT